MFWIGRKTDKAAGEVETKAALPAPASLASPSPFLLEMFGAIPSTSGVVVTPSTALRSTAVRAAVRALSEGVAYLPVKVYARNDTGTRDQVDDHPVAGLLDDAASDFVTGTELREVLTADSLLHGDGLAYIGRAGDGRPVELTRLAPDAVTIDADARGFPTYKVGNQTIPPLDVLHLRAPSSTNPQHFRGSSPIRECRNAIGLQLVLEDHASRLFSNGARPSGTLNFPTDAKLNPEELERILAAWNATHGGANSGKTGILYEGGSFQQLTMNSVDAQFMELWTKSTNEIARAFRVPPTIIGELERGTWGNAEEMGSQFLNYSLLPWIRRWEGEVALKLFTSEDRARFTMKLNVDAFLRTNLAARATAYSQLVAARVMNPNEVRRLEDLPPYTGGDLFANPHVDTSARGQA